MLLQLGKDLFGFFDYLSYRPMIMDLGINLDGASMWKALFVNHGLVAFQHVAHVYYED